MHTKTISSEDVLIAGGAKSIAFGTLHLGVRQNRELEKMQLQGLNDKLADYISEVRSLSGLNHQKEKELEYLENILLSDRYSSKMRDDELQRRIENVPDSSNAESELTDLQGQIKNAKEKYDDVQNDKNTEELDENLLQLSNLEAEIALVKRRIALIDEEVQFLRNENSILMTNLAATRSKADQQSIMALQLRNQLTVLKEEFDVINSFNEESDGIDYFGNELQNAMSDIRSSHDKVLSSYRQELEYNYSNQIRELETQATKGSIDNGFYKSELVKGKTQLGDMRNKLAEMQGRNAQLEKQIEELLNQQEDDYRIQEMELNERERKIQNEKDKLQALMVEYQIVLDQKQTLDAEIAIYRRMLEGDDQGSGLKQLVEQVVRATSINENVDTETTRVIKGESSSKIAHSVTAKGHIAIKLVKRDESIVVLENRHSEKDENLEGWKLVQTVDGERSDVVLFPSLIIPHGTLLTIASSNENVEEIGEVFVLPGLELREGVSWSICLQNSVGEERANYSQRNVDYTVLEQ